MVTLLNTTLDSQAKAICADHGNAPDALLEILHALQAEVGFLKDGALRTIADCLNISRADVHGVASFYHDYLREKAADVRIKICRAEACQAMGVNDLISEAETAFGTKLDDHAGNNGVALEAAYCLGNCALGPAAMIGDDLYGRVTLEKLKALASQAQTNKVVA